MAMWLAMFQQLGKLLGPMPLNHLCPDNDRPRISSKAGYPQKSTMAVQESPAQASIVAGRGGLPEPAHHLRRWPDFPLR